MLWWAWLAGRQRVASSKNVVPGCDAYRVKVIQGHRFALNPAPGRARNPERQAGAARFAFNWGLADTAGVDDDLVRDVTEILTSPCARLYGRGAAANRAARLAAIAAELPAGDDG
jgi:hypothetical protein